MYIRQLLKIVKKHGTVWKCSQSDRLCTSAIYFGISKPAVAKIIIGAIALYAIVAV
jgi:hypothetical protein